MTVLVPFMWLWIYRLAFVPVLLVLAPKVLWRMRRRGGYREDFSQRFGAVPPLPPRTPGRARVWIQAVSVGEVLAIEPLVDALLTEPNVELYLTTTTSTGLAVARQRYEGRVLAVAYFPLDWAPIVRRAWRCIDPSSVILAEGERWPEHIAQAERRGVPVSCVNARLSDRSYRRMRQWSIVVRGLFRGVTQFLAVSEEDAARFRALGFGDHRVVVTGNLKVDVTLTELTPAETHALREELGLRPDSLVVLGSSTWPGEEAALVEAWQAARRAGNDCQLVLVPRHEERRDEVESVVQAAGVPYHLRSRGPTPGPVEIAVVDTTGELRRVTQVADLVFVGKSLAPHHEGQTPVEAAVLGRPLVFGTRMSNFRAIARELVAAGAARVVESPLALNRVVEQLLRDPAARARMAAAGRAWHETSRGSLRRTLEHVRPLLFGRSS